MKILLRQAKVYHQDSPIHLKRVDMLINRGKIEAISTTPLDAKGALEISREHLSVSVGWCDLGAHLGEPGMEHREDLLSLTKAAAAGGFTAIAPFPNTYPTIDNKAGVQYMLNKTAGGLVEVYPIGAATVGCKGRDITEMLDLKAAGAIAYSDGLESIQHAGVLMRALLYAQGFDGLILDAPLDHSLSEKGQVHEGLTSTVMGVPGIPELAEIIAVKRNIDLLQYTNGRLHLGPISAGASVEEIKKAKKSGLRITSSVPVYNLFFDDSDMEDFDLNLKVMPPLRTKNDIKLLKKGLRDGTIDCMVSNHVPLDTEAKDLEFPHAQFGAIGLESAFAVANTALKKDFPSEKIVDLLVSGCRKVLGLPIPSIHEGADANLTIFDPEKEWVFSSDDLYSKSRNCPVLGKKLSGKVIGVINHGQSWLNPSG